MADVRDVAAAHILAAEAPSACGRYIVSFPTSTSARFITDALKVGAAAAVPSGAAARAWLQLQLHWLRLTASGGRLVGDGGSHCSSSQQQQRQHAFRLRHASTYPEAPVTRWQCLPLRASPARQLLHAAPPQAGIPGLAVPDGEEHPSTSNIDNSRAIRELGLQYHDPADTFVSMARSLMSLGIVQPLLSS
jgi:hypothetical protein